MNINDNIKLTRNFKSVGILPNEMTNKKVEDSL